MLKRIILMISTLFLLLGCVSTYVDSNKPLVTLQHFFSTQDALKTPRVSTTKNQLLLSWVRASSTTQQLMYAIYRDKQWSTPRAVVKGNNWFINYADYAKVEAIDEQHFIASWLEQSNTTSTHYQFKIKQSFDAGETWMETTSPLLEKDAEHGFISVVKKDGKALFTWISQVGKGYQIQSSQLDSDNQWSSVQIVDNASCSCCHTDMAKQENRVYSVYRNRTDEEIRDIAINIYQNQQWGKPNIIHDDGWKIKGCPVNGPSISANKNAYVIIWYTFSGGVRQAKLLVHSNTQRHVISIDKEAIGFVDSAIVNDVTAIVSWLSIANNEIFMNVQLVNLLDGSLGIKKTFKIDQKTMGFPSIGVFDGQLFVVNESDSKGIQIQQFDLKNGYFRKCSNC